MGIFSWFGKSSTLYFPGCATYFKHNDNFKLYQEIFSRLGIGFKTIDKNVCCGLPVLEGGYELNTRRLARRNFEIFKEEEIDSIITNSPCCYKMFLQDYSELLPDWDIEVRDVWDVILEKLENKPDLIRHKAMEVVTYHDSCYLGRYCGVYDAPRKIMELIGYEIKEMEDFKESSICCGSCGGLPRTNPELANKIAKQRILQAKRIGVDKIVVCSLEAYDLLKKNSLDSGVEVLEFSEVLAVALGISKREDFEEEYVSDEEKILLETKSNIDFEEELKEEDYYDEPKRDSVL